jgi:hypothetical protein
VTSLHRSAPARRGRAATRVVTAGLAGLVTTVLTAAPAWAGDPLGPSEGADPGKGLGPGLAVLLYVGIPLAVFAVIAAVVLLPGALRGHRYRPAEGWSAAPVWFAGPVDPDAAVAAAQPGDVTRGGASGSW